MSKTAIFTVIASGIFIRDTDRDDEKPVDGGTKNVKMRPAELGEELEYPVDDSGMPPRSVQPFVDLTRAKLGIEETYEDEDEEDEFDDEDE